MLEPQDRVLLRDMLRPPDGHELSWAIGTTFTLDLVAAMAAPMAFALFDWDEGEQGVVAPIALLEALRRYSDRLTVFVQAGQIAVPKPQQYLLAYLEDAIVESLAPTKGGLFHPKIWLLRFEAKDHSVRYRFGCLSRNLTFDRAWDAALIIDGPVTDRERAFSANHPLADFIGSLPTMATRTLSPIVRKRVREACREVLRVNWDLPPGVETVTFWPLGIDGHRRSPMNTRVDRLLVVSPFLGQPELVRLTKRGQHHVLVSRLESLQGVEDLSPFANAFVLDDVADIGGAQEDEAQLPTDHILQGLHAKIYVADAGWKASVWTGSANATEAAFGANVEFLVELRGPKSLFGIEALLAKGSGQPRFADLLTPYVNHEYKPADELEEGLRARIEEVRRLLVRAVLVASVGPEMTDRQYSVALTPSRRIRKLPDEIAVMCWPVMVGEGASVPLAPGASEWARFVVSEEELSSLFAFSIEARQDSRKRAERFTLNLVLQGAPEDRHSRILRFILRDRDRVLRFLLFLLADGDPAQVARLLSAKSNDRGDDGQTSPDIVELPLFESLVHALEREPTKLDHVARLLADLRKSAEGESLIPSGFSEIWDPIWAVREAMR